MRQLSTQFMDALQAEAGLLRPLLTRVKRDDTLMLAIRSDYLNIYYRGGSLLQLSAQTGRYKAIFDHKYNKTSLPLPELPAHISSLADTSAWIDAIPALKQAMDFFLALHPKAEREFQQLVARENNQSGIAKQTDYFITDIEFADSEIGARFDMLAIQRVPQQRLYRPALIEMKYGDGALGGSAGVLKHLQDIDELVENRPKYTALLNTMLSQFNQLDALGLLDRSRSMPVAFDPAAKPEIIFLLANHNPRSSQLKAILSDPQVAAYGAMARFDLRFSTSSFAGYGLYADGLLDLQQFRALL